MQSVAKHLRAKSEVDFFLRFLATLEMTRFWNIILLSETVEGFVNVA